MKIQIEWNLDKINKETEIFFVGNVQDVIFSRAKNTIRLPRLFNGFGACGTNNPATVGEGIIFRGCTAGTPANPLAGINIDYHIQLDEIYTPFFVGWNGSPSFIINFISETGITLNQLYQDIFSKIQRLESSENFEYVFLEIIGLFNPTDIFDRALQKRVDNGNVLTTLPENAGKFFKSRIIYSDLVSRNVSTAKLFPLFISGAGYFCKDSVELQPLRETVFYMPPQQMEKTEINASDSDIEKVLTHNHALGWRGGESTAENLLSSICAGVQSADNAQTVEDSVNELLKYEPDYLVHLDDWSILKAATVKVFLADSNHFNIKSTAIGED